LPKITDTAGLSPARLQPCRLLLASFWDIETSKLLTRDTLLGAGWDFVDETENGNKCIWWFLEGQDYPLFWRDLIPEN